MLMPAPGDFHMWEYEHYRDNGTYPSKETQYNYFRAHVQKRLEAIARGEK